MHESVVSEMQSENWLLKGDLEERKHADPKNTPSTEGLDRQYRDQGKWKQNPQVKVRLKYKISREIQKHLISCFVLYPKRDF